MASRTAALALLIAFLLLPAATARAQTWVEGEMGYRISVVPEGSPGARHGLAVGDILAEPQPLPAWLAESGPDGVEIPMFRRVPSSGTYVKRTIRITFREGEEKRLGLTGDIGFLVSAVKPGSLGARAELLAGDFIDKIDETFVHSTNDLTLV